MPKGIYEGQEKEMQVDFLGKSEFYKEIIESC